MDGCTRAITYDLGPWPRPFALLSLKTTDKPRTGTLAHALLDECFLRQFSKSMGSHSSAFSVRQYGPHCNNYKIDNYALFFVLSAPNPVRAQLANRLDSIRVGQVEDEICCCLVARQLHSTQALHRHILTLELLLILQQPPCAVR